MLKRLRRDHEASRAQGKDSARRRRGRERRNAGKAVEAPAVVKATERKTSRTKARRKARFLKVALFQDRAVLARRARRIRRPSTLRALPRKVRGLLRDLA